jgi:hypothetical protein
MTSKIAAIAGGITAGAILTGIGWALATPRPLPEASTSPSLPTATITITPAPKVITKQAPPRTITKTLPQATITKTIKVPAKQLPKATKHRITEDDPKWNCKTMGNKRCGKVVAGGNYPALCKKVPEGMRADCAALYRRKATKQIFSDGSEAWSPAGPALVRECLSYKGLELRECLRP